jgi:diketogulonate reductase-like aldo/keto reductase
MSILSLLAKSPFELTPEEYAIVKSELDSVTDEQISYIIGKFVQRDRVFIPNWYTRKHLVEKAEYLDIENAEEKVAELDLQEFGSSMGMSDEFNEMLDRWIEDKLEG